jgi:hypothetical protein
VLSFIVIVCEAVAVLPQASVAVHVLVITIGHPVETVTSTKVNVGFGSQASVTVGVDQTGVAGHAMVWFGPTPLITGAVLSSIVIVCEAVAVLPQASVAVHVLVVTIRQPTVLVTSTKVKVAIPQSSVTVGVDHTGVVPTQLIVWFGPTPEITGAVLSFIVIVCEAVAVLPQASVAVHVLVITIGHPVETVTSTKVNVGFGSQLSVTVGVDQTGVAGHAIVWFGPTPLKTGAVLSETTAVCTIEPEFPQASVAVHNLMIV